jgi:exodeoxyribonuclease-5
MIMLNDQQAAGLEKVAYWYAGHKEYAEAGYPGGADVFTWFGYAGTGKTFTAARIPEALGLRNVVFGTYTGKAASVLRRSLANYGAGYPVSTIHSAIYFPTTSREAREALDEARTELAVQRKTLEDWEILGGDGTVAGQDIASEIERTKGRISWLEAELPVLEANARRLRFELNPDSDWAFADLIILDEVSMVNAKLAADIESFGVPILVLGDPAQLPPVEGGGYYTDRTPDVLLTKIERQAIEGNPIVELATRVRTSQEGLGLTRADVRAPSLSEAMEADMVLCWTNKRRWSLINAIRNRLGRVAGTVVAGDVIMNLTNNKDAAVFNGQTFTVLHGRPARDPRLGWDLLVADEEGRERELLVHAEGFVDQETQVRAKNVGMGMKGQRLLCTYAQAITVHKAQGSEADRVYIVDETPSMIAMTAKRAGPAEALAQARQWAYTAITRARESVVIARPS